MVCGWEIKFGLFLVLCRVISNFAVDNELINV